jgi:hypothetical protein
LCLPSLLLSHFGFYCQNWYNKVSWDRSPYICCVSRAHKLCRQTLVRMEIAQKIYTSTLFSFSSSSAMRQENQVICCLSRKFSGKHSRRPEAKLENVNGGASSTAWLGFIFAVPISGVWGWGS